MSNGRYILEGKIPVPCEDLITWARWIEIPTNRIVKQQFIGDLWISTVFLGLDHNMLFPDSPPQLFETLVFRDSTDEDRREMEALAVRVGYTGKVTCPRHVQVDDGYSSRSATWEMALEEHAKAVKWAKKRLH